MASQHRAGAGAVLAVRSGGQWARGGAVLRGRAAPRLRRVPFRLPIPSGLRCAGSARRRLPCPGVEVLQVTALLGSHCGYRHPAEVLRRRRGAGRSRQRRRGPRAEHGLWSRSCPAPPAPAALSLQVSAWHYDAGRRELPLLFIHLAVHGLPIPAGPWQFASVPRPSLLFILKEDWTTALRFGFRRGNAFDTRKTQRVKPTSLKSSLPRCCHQSHICGCELSAWSLEWWVRGTTSDAAGKK
ncbi:uncharacterized protein LOC136006200 [Lathamus discolor]|uniref:uncharacterized protein LOC136006200 n=1 Tax=Lathamus discolor TaxID=678569 RepID=UPI0032B7F265